MCFTITILKYGVWTTFRKEVEMDKEDPKGHLTHALSELWLFAFDHVDGVVVTTNSYEEEENDDGELLGEVRVENNYEWGGEDFKHFIDSFISSKVKL